MLSHQITNEVAYPCKFFDCATLRRAPAFAENASGNLKRPGSFREGSNSPSGPGSKAPSAGSLTKLTTGSASAQRRVTRGIGEVLKPAGYVSGAFGKWGVGDAHTDGAATRQGFEEFFGYYHQVHAHFYYPTYLWHNDRKVYLPRARSSSRLESR